jgi:uncharacterized protein
MAKNLKEALMEFLRIDGVSASAIIGRDGFVIESASKVQLDMDALGAVVASSIGASEMLGKDFEMGGLDQLLLEFAMGKAIIASIGNDILTVITGPDTVIGSVRYSVRKSAAAIQKML